MGPVRPARSMRALWLATGALAACTSRESSFVPLPTFDADQKLAFLLSLTPQLDRILELHASLDLASQEAAEVRVEAPGESVLALLLLDDAAIRALGVRRDEDAVDLHRLAPAPEACARGALSIAGDASTLRINATVVTQPFLLASSSSSFERIAAEDAPALGLVSVEFPILGSSCPMVSSGSAESFDPSHPLLLPRGATVRGAPAYQGEMLAEPHELRDFVLLSEDHLIGMSALALLHARRGEAFQDVPARVLTAEDVLGLPPTLLGAGSWWRWVAVAAVPPRTGAPRQLAALLQDVPNETGVPARSAAVNVTLGSEGFVSAETSTVVPDALRALIVDHRGLVLALGEAALMTPQARGQALAMHAPDPEGPWTRSLLPEVLYGNVLAQSGLTDPPHLAGFTGGEMLLGDLIHAPQDARLVRAGLEAARTGRIQSLGSHTDEGGGTFWAGDIMGWIHRGRMHGDRVETLDYRLPIESWACRDEADTCGWPMTRKWITAIEPLMGGRGIAVALMQCDSVPVLRNDDLCPSALPVPPSGPSLNAHRRVRRLGDRLYVSAANSEVHVVRTP